MNNLSQNKINKFRNSLPRNDDYYRIYDRIIDSIKFYDTNNILEMIKNALKVFLEEIENDDRMKYILLPYNKCGSEHWLFKECEDLLDDFEITYEIFEDDIEESIIILIIDDAIYSGVNVTNLIRRAVPSSIDSSIYIISALVARFGMGAILNLKKKLSYPYIEIFYSDKIKNVIDIFSDFDKKDWDIFNDINYHIAYNNLKDINPNTEMVNKNTFGDVFKGPYFNPTTVFLGHKIANEFGTLRFLITLLIDKPINRSRIDKVCQNWNF